MRITRKLLPGALAVLAALFSFPLRGALRSDNVYIVVLEEKSLAEMVLQWAPQGSREEWKQLLAGSRGGEYVARLSASKRARFQSRFARLPGSPSQPGRPRLLQQGEVALNYMVVEGGLDEVQGLAEEIRVKGIYPVRERFLQTDAMPELLGATEAWEMLGGIDQAGAGVKIGFIDSGLTISHPMFQADGLEPPPGYPLGGFPEEVNGKVIVARNYVRQELGLNAQPIRDPRDELGHGSRVVGVAAGTPTETLIGILRGIAPRAYIGSYKVFGDPRLNGTTTNAAVLQAVNDAIADGMDVINLSLGGPALNPSSDPEQQAISNASALGTVFVVAAGNYGTRGAGSVTSPGTSPEALTVGSGSHGRVLLPRAVFTSEDIALPDELQVVPYQPSNGGSIEMLTEVRPLSHIAHLDPSEQACGPLPAGSLQGVVALVRRGGCTFLEKAENVVGSAQAEGLLVYNNELGRPIIMDFSGEIVPVPAVMIGLEAGEALSQILQTGMLPGSAPQQNAVQIGVQFYPQTDMFTFTAFPAEPDQLSVFSGLGPSFNSIKPDLISIGESILSADRCRPSFVNCGVSYSNPSNTQGTSFSTPAVSGAAALVRQLHPDWPSSWIRSAIVNSTTKSVTRNGLPATVNQGGNGRLDILAALQTPLVFEPLSMSFGPLQNQDRGSREFVIHNVSGQTQLLRLTVQEALNEAGIAFSVDPVEVTLLPGESADASFRFDAGSGLGTGFFEGFVRVETESLSPAGGEPSLSSLSISYWGAVSFSIGGRVLQVAQDGSAPFQTVGAALAAALPRDTIEILDSALYQENLEIATDGNGIPLHGLTLKAAAGARPRIEGDGGLVLAARGVVELTIKDLEFSGGRIELEDSTGLLENTRIDGLEVAGVALLSFSNSHFHFFHNEIVGAESTALGLFNASSALIQDNRIGSSDQPIGQHGFFAGNQSQASLFQNLMDSPGARAQTVGQGFRFSAASGLLRANRIIRAGGPQSDGILVQGMGVIVDSSQNLISGQSRFGIYLRDYAHLQSTADRLLDNAAGGIRLELQASGAFRQTQLFGNGLGGSVEDSSLQVSDSLVAGVTAGFDLLSGQLGLHRSTVFGHSGPAIKVTSGTLAADHNIFSENAGGDLQGDGAAGLTFNLTDGLSTAGSNVPGMAHFVDPLNFDFSLTAQSDAIDRGDPAVCCLEGDFFAHSRIVDGNGDSQAVLDMGGIEFGSTATPALVAPVLSTTETTFMGLALASAAGRLPEDPESSGSEDPPAQVRLQAYDQSGQKVGDLLTLNVSSETQAAFLVGDHFPPAARWIEILPSGRDLLSFTLVGAGNLEFMDGAQLAPAARGPQLLPEVKVGAGSNTTLFLVNPGELAQQVSITLHRSGAPNLDAALNLIPRGSQRVDIAQLFPQASSGYLIVEGDGPLFAMELFGDDDSRAGLLGLPVEAASERLFGAQLASSPQIETRINLINLGETAASATLIVRAEDGSTVASSQIALGAGSQLTASAKELFGLGPEVVDGWLEVVAEGGKMVGNLIFGDPDGHSSAALPLQSVGAREFYLSHIAESDDIFTGITLLNSELAPALVTIEAFDPAGGLLGRSFQILQGREKRAYLLRELVADIGQQSGGFLRVRSTRKILGFELFGNQNLEFLSAVPQQKVVE